MALLSIVNENNEIIRKTCRVVDKITPRIKQIIDDMIEMLDASGGCGLAANQVGILRRIAIVKTDELYVLINPEIIYSEGEQQGAEGCLSCPNQYGLTKRPAIVTVRALDVDGNEFTVTRDGLTACALCHEIDHLNGKLYKDKGTLIRMLDPSEIKPKKS